MVLDRQQFSVSAALACCSLNCDKRQCTSATTATLLLLLRSVKLLHQFWRFSLKERKEKQAPPAPHSARLSIAAAATTAAAEKIFTFSLLVVPGGRGLELLQATCSLLLLSTFSLYFCLYRGVPCTLAHSVNLRQKWVPSSLVRRHPLELELLKKIVNRWLQLVIHTLNILNFILKRNAIKLLVIY